MTQCKAGSFFVQKQKMNTFRSKIKNSIGKNKFNDRTKKSIEF